MLACLVEVELLHILKADVNRSLQLLRQVQTSTEKMTLLFQVSPCSLKKKKKKKTRGFSTSDEVSKY